MKAKLDRLGLGRVRQLGEGLARFGMPRRFGRGVWLPAAILIGCGAWLLLPASKGQIAQSAPPQGRQASIQSEPSSPEPLVGAAPVGTRASDAELDQLRISSQTWRRGGLGSKALVTFTVRNDNDYAVKDVEILCSFSRRDGSHLTDRRRMLPDTVKMKSRRTFARVPIGFVNVNARQAKCAVAAARRA